MAVWEAIKATVFNLKDFLCPLYRFSDENRYFIPATSSCKTLAVIIPIYRIQKHKPIKHSKWNSFKSKSIDTIGENQKHLQELFVIFS
jgi:hypothetical protein